MSEEAFGAVSRALDARLTPIEVEVEACGTLVFGRFPAPHAKQKSRGIIGRGFPVLAAPETARLLSLSGRTLEKDRTYGTGTAYRKIGGRVVYVIEDLKAWADRGTKMSTSAPGVGAVLRAKRHVAVSPAYTDRPRR